MYNQFPQQTPRAYLKQISIIHIALFTGQLLFGLVTLFITPQKGIDITNTNDPFLYVVPIVALGSLAASAFLFKLNLNMAIDKDSLNGKLMLYQAALIVKLAPLEGASLLGIVSYMLTGNLLFIIISGLMALYFLSLRPTKDKIANDLDLSYEDKLLFDNQE
jgi:hypothetical protein